MSILQPLFVLQETLVTFPLFPILWTAHCIVQCLSLRVTLNNHHGNALDFARQNPLSCFILTIFYTFPGGIMGCILSSEPPLAVLANTNQVVVMLLSWYLIFYCPNDFFEKIISAFFLRTPMCILQDFQRLHLVIIGVNKIHKLYPNALLYPVVYATCSSSGFMFLKAT
jgi:TRIC channel